MKPENKITVFQTPDELAEAAGEFIAEVALNAVRVRGRFVISFSGGNTPEQLYSLLSKPPFRDQVPWNKTFIFWGDERCVPAEDMQNNAHMADTILLDHIDIQRSNINPVPVYLSPEEAAYEYEKTIKKFFGDAPPSFDIILLGLGENGHTASLFPGTDVIFDTTHLVKEVYVPEQRMFRITMTPHLINQAHNIIFLVEGSGKTDILKTVLTTSYQPDKFPAQVISPTHGNLYWFVDNKAANFLPANLLA